MFGSLLHRTFAVGTLCLAVAGVAQADEKALIAAQYAMADSAFFQRNVAGVLAIATADLKLKGLDGKVSGRKEVGLMLQRQFKLASKINGSKTTIDSFVLKGKTAVATTTTRSVFMMATKDKKNIAVRATSKSKDTWVLKGSTWLMNASVSLKQDTLFNGKTLDEFMKTQKPTKK